ncbi:AGE family epimerase/isomerase [Priestia aryabhattai]|nr:AGE family epimerase/isomerase [Priestia aryabhattai]
MDYEKGGYINGFLVDGSVNDTNTKHLVATGRYIYNFSIGVILGGKSWCLEAARHGIQFLNKHHLDKQHDGYFFEMNDLGVKNSAKMPMVMPLFCWILNSLQSRCGRGKRSVGQRLQCR